MTAPCVEVDDLGVEAEPGLLDDQRLEGVGAVGPAPRVGRGPGPDRRSASSPESSPASAAASSSTRASIGNGDGSSPRDGASAASE